MYVKIQKDIDRNYLLIETKDAEISTNVINMTFSDYLDKFLPCLLEYDEAFNIQNGVYKNIKFIFGEIDWEKTKAVTTYSLYELKNKKSNDDSKPQINCNCEVKGIKVNGVYYITCGRIYIMNENGKTIQSI